MQLALIIRCCMRNEDRQSTARERERETETDRESCKSLDGLYYKPFSTWQVRALWTHTHRFPCFMGTFHRHNVFSTVQTFLSPCPKPKQNVWIFIFFKILNSVWFISLFLHVDLKECHHKIKMNWYYYDCGDLRSRETDIQYSDRTKTDRPAWRIFRSVTLIL